MTLHTVMNTQNRALFEASAAETARADAEWNRADDVRQRLEESTREADEEERLGKLAEQLARLAVQRAEAATKLAHGYGLILSGEYYSPLEHVWGNDTAVYGDAALFEALRREKTPTFVEGRPRPQPAGTTSSYSVTLQKARTTRLYRPGADGSGSVDVEAQEALWRTNVSGEPEVDSSASSSW
jgi:hypothetical protein